MMRAAAHCGAMLATLYGAYSAKSVTTVFDAVLHLDTGESDFFIEAEVDGDPHAIAVVLGMASIHGFEPMEELEGSSVYFEETGRLRVYLVPNHLLPALRVAI